MTEDATEAWFREHVRNLSPFFSIHHHSISVLSEFISTRHHFSTCKYRQSLENGADFLKNDDLQEPEAAARRAELYEREEVKTSICD